MVTERGRGCSGGRPATAAGAERGVWQLAITTIARDTAAPLRLRSRASLDSDPCAWRDRSGGLPPGGGPVAPPVACPGQGFRSRRWRRRAGRRRGCEGDAESGLRPCVAAPLCSRGGRTGAAPAASRPPLQVGSRRSSRWSSAAPARALLQVPTGGRVTPGQARRLPGKRVVRPSPDDTSSGGWRSGREHGSRDGAAAHLDEPWTRCPRRRGWRGGVGVGECLRAASHGADSRPTCCERVGAVPHPLRNRRPRARARQVFACWDPAACAPGTPRDVDTAPSRGARAASAGRSRQPPSAGGPEDGCVVARARGAPRGEAFTSKHVGPVT